MKKAISLMLALTFAVAALTGCVTAPASKGVSISVVTSYGGDDGNRSLYEKFVKAYEEASGNTVKDASSTANEEWKAKVMTDFETGAEPDVLFYFNGMDSNKFVGAGKVVSIEEIRKEFPNYANNMKDESMGASPVDGVNYSVPVNGYWEAMYVNKKVLTECGIAVPGDDYTWEQFIEDCETIKAAGYTPIAASIHEIPHYWFEYATYNYSGPGIHEAAPEEEGDAAAKLWALGLYEIKDLYERGFFPVNTTTASDQEVWQLMFDDKAAFAIDGSWKIGNIVENATDLADFTVVFPPSKENRETTDIIGGLSMGYYITRKAWDNPDKRQACVDFVMAMTSDEVVNEFGWTAATALKNGTTPAADANSLQIDAVELLKRATAVSVATEDQWTQTQRGHMFQELKNIAAGTKTAEEVISEGLKLK